MTWYREHVADPADFADALVILDDVDVFVSVAPCSGCGCEACVCAADVEALKPFARDRRRRLRDGI